MSKKRIIITAAVGLLSFSGTFVLAWLTQSAPSGQPAEEPGLSQETTPAESSFEFAKPQVDAGTGDQRMLDQKHLASLIGDVKEKIREYEDKFDALDVREQRLKVAQDVVKKDIEKLDSLRIDIASKIASLKTQQDKLLKVRVEIEEAERTNLMSVAATYDKMDPASASQILTTMSKTSGQMPGQGTGLDEAVKILHYMTERTKAKLLAELVSSEPTLAATLCRRLKQVR